MPPESRKCNAEMSIESSELRSTSEREKTHSGFTASTAFDDKLWRFAFKVDCCQANFAVDRSDSRWTSWYIRRWQFGICCVWLTPTATQIMKHRNCTHCYGTYSRHSGVYAHTTVHTKTIDISGSEICDHDWSNTHHVTWINNQCWPGMLAGM